MNSLCIYANFISVRIKLNPIVIHFLNQALGSFLETGAASSLEYRVFIDD